MTFPHALSALLAVLCLVGSASAQGKLLLRQRLSDLAVEDGWIYDDVDAGFAEARRTGKPILVVFRCVP